MNHRLHFLVFILTASSFIVWLAVAGEVLHVSPRSAGDDSNRQQLDYPVAQRLDLVETHFDLAIADPYRWLEDLDSDTTNQWIRAQDELARQYTEGLDRHATWVDRLERLLEADRPSRPYRRGEQLFTFVRRGGDRLPVVMVESDDQPARILIEAPMTPATATAIQEPQTIVGWLPSPDGEHVAYGIAPLGSPWGTWRIRNVESGRDASDVLTGLYGGTGNLVWAPDGRGFFYEYFLDEPGEPPTDGRTGAPGAPTVRFHRLGTNQAEDPTLYRKEGEDWSLRPLRIVDQRWLSLSEVRGSSATNRLLIHDLDAERAFEQGAFAPLTHHEAAWRLIDARGETFFLLTDHDAPKQRVVTLTRGATASIDEIIAEGAFAISSVVATRRHLVVLATEAAKPTLRTYRIDGTFERMVDLPRITWTSIRDSDDESSWVSLSGLNDAGTTFRLDAATGQLTPVVAHNADFHPEDFVTRQIFYDGLDGTRIPMFIAHHVDLDLDAGPHPTILYGYGAFAWAAVPWYQPELIPWLEQGGIYALANIRGGGEFGATWYQAGIREQKQTAIDDYLAAAAALVKEQLSHADTLVANGGSASGPLVGAAIVQRPELFAAALIEVPAFDMVRFATLQGGSRWVQEWGSPENEQELRALHAYSPYHNLQQGTCYPATMIIAGERDQTIAPSHAYKFTAALQAAQGCDNPVLLQVAWGAGHSVGSTPALQAASHARRLAFASRAVRASTMDAPKP
ncbi:MAG: prolyl oligopeptidase family serine peptidase [Acidobacteriota bacterium]